MIILRTFYIFRVKKEFVDLYRNNPSSLYNILRHLYFMKRHDYKYGFDLFNQICKRIDKDLLDRELYIKYHKALTYSKNGNDHVINNLYKDEVSILNIKRSYILINTNKNYTSFFNIIGIFGEEYFVCDFNYQDYFWINDIKILV